MPPVALHDALEQIMDAAVAALNGQKDPGELLNGINSVVRGDKARQRPDTPALWVFCEGATNTHTTAGLAETWALPLVLVSVVQANDPEVGYREATKYAARARKVILGHGGGNSRKLGLEYVRDVVSTRFDPTAPWLRNKEGTLFGAAAVVTVHFRVTDD